MNRSDCEKYFDSIEDLFEGELGEESAEKLNSHVFACPRCAGQYEKLRREKEIYARYLFDVEPPPDSWINFQRRLAAENKKAPGETVSTALNSSRRRKRTFVFGFSPALAACAGLLLLAGIGFVWLKNAALEKGDDKTIAQTGTDESQSASKPGVTEQESSADSAAKITRGNETARQNNETVGKIQTLKTGNNFPADRKSFIAAAVKIRQSSARPGAKKNPSGEIRSNERELLLARTKKLETEIAGQIEKIELLLRSFRNARELESPEIFDVYYEKEQARRLLGKNERLRRDAENYGILYAEELLSRVEPYLLEIANLEANPAPGKVLDIKERVSSQNIIASLQVYNSAAAVQ
ncbi:MAG TPA: hypothetical protein VF721_14600 [Pyrinomonadaceae bacterium]|jgi:uncharacterized protein YfiM (DUF2279 family)